MSKPRIDIIQWREPYDDEDTLSIYAYAPDQMAANEDDNLADIRWQFALDEPGDDADYDAPGQIIVNASISIGDGEVIRHKGRKFRISITEETAA